MSYLVIPQIRVQAANMLSASFLIGGPPVLTSFFFAHALARKIDRNTSVTGVAFIHHQMTPLGQVVYGRFHPQQRRAASFTFGSKTRDYVKQSLALSLQPVANAHMLLSLVIEIDNPLPDDEIKKYLYNGRFSGGQIIGHGNPTIHDELDDVIDQIPSGYLVMDRKDLLEPGDGKNQAELMIEHLGRVPSAAAGNTWLSAACLGYASTTPFEKRTGAREGYSHAFVEPLVGLVQYQSVRNFKTSDANLEQIVWRPQWDTKNNVYHISQTR